MVDSIGKRLAYLRQKNGWTQQSLADRLAMSRVAISHMEMDITIPSERSITLMAGVFKMSPVDLVEGTTYPRAKAERLPILTTIFTELELNYALLLNDTEWLDRLDDPHIKNKYIREILAKWHPILENWGKMATDEHETNIIFKMRQILKGLNYQMNHQRE
jgi:transcriptional regulator with XRE-family HTH domain